MIFLRQEIVQGQVCGNVSEDSVPTNQMVYSCFPFIKIVEHNTNMAVSYSTPVYPHLWLVLYPLSMVNPD